MFSLSLPFLLIRRSPDNELRSDTDLLDELALGEISPPQQVLTFPKVFTLFRVIVIVHVNTV